jgi:hypothetical protein
MLETKHFEITRKEASIISLLVASIIRILTTNSTVIVSSIDQQSTEVVDTTNASFGGRGCGYKKPAQV